MAKGKQKQERKLRGSSRMRQSGYRRVEIWLDAKEMEGLRRAAGRNLLPLAAFVKTAALHAAL